MDWKSFALGAAVGLAAGAGVGYFIANQYELVDEDEFEDLEGTLEPVGTTGCPETIYDEIAIAETIRKYEPFAEDLEDADETPSEMKDAFAEWMEDEAGIRPTETDVEDPYVISAEEYDEGNPSWDKVMLTFYPDYDLLITDSEELVDDPTIMLGRCVTNFLKNTWREGESESDIVYIRNARYSTDYEVELCDKFQARGWIRDYLEGMDG